MQFGDVVVALGPWIWFVVAVVMLALETVIPGVHFMWFGLAAAFVGAAALAWPLSLATQLIAFAVVALAAIVFFRRFWGSRTLTSDAPDLNERAHQYVGRVVTVAEAIAGGRGKVRVGDTVWTAEGPDAIEGAQVQVTGVNGTVLRVGGYSSPQVR